MHFHSEQVTDHEIADYLHRVHAPVGPEGYFRLCALNGISREVASTRDFIKGFMVNYSRKELKDENIAEALRQAGLSITVEEYFAEQNRRNENEARRRMKVVDFIQEAKLAQQETVISTKKTILHGTH